MLLSARARRPWRPITFPTSAGATWRWNTTASSRSSVSTRTESGSSTSRRAIHSRSSAVGAPDADGLDELRHRLGRLRALREPRGDLRLVEVDRRRVRLWVVASDDLDETAVPRGARVGHDDAVDRILL